MDGQKGETEKAQFIFRERERNYFQDHRRAFLKIDSSKQIQ